MVQITTNAFANLIPERLEEVDLFASSLFGQENLHLENPKKTPPEGSKISCSLTRLPLRNLSESTEKWLGLGALLSAIYSLILDSITSARSVHFFMQAEQDGLSVNIFWTVQSEDELRDQLALLRDTIIVADIYGNGRYSANTVLVIGFDAEAGTWRINAL